MDISNKKKYSFQMPDTYVIIFFVVVFAAMLTYIVPTGKFNVYYSIYNKDNKIIEKVNNGESKKFKINNKQNFIIIKNQSIYSYL